MPKSWGSVTIGAPLITRSGLVFIGASMDARVRAIDLSRARRSGRRWSTPPPATYMYRGRQYVVFVAGGNTILKPQASDQVAAFALK
jgi:quinoprotein glucose dehydrogenase